MSQYLALNTKDFKWINTHSFIYSKVIFIDAEMLRELLEISKDTVFAFRSERYINLYSKINLGVLKDAKLPLTMYYQLNRYNVVVDGKYYYPLEYVKMCAMFKKDIVDALYVVSRIMEEIKINVTNTISDISNYLKSEFNLSLNISQRTLYKIIYNNKGLRFDKCLEIYNSLLQSGVVKAYDEQEIDFSYWTIDITPYFKDIININNCYTIEPLDKDNVIIKSNNLDINNVLYISPSKCSMILGITKALYIQKVNNPVVDHYDNIFISTMANSRIYYEGKSYYPVKLVEQYAEELTILKDYLNKIVNIVNNLVANKIKTTYLADIAGVSTMVIRNIVYKKNTKINNIISLTNALRDNADNLNIKVPEAPTNLCFFNLG